MRILYVITRSERGGAQSNVLSLIKSRKSTDENFLFTGSIDSNTNKDFLISEAKKINKTKIFHVCPSLVAEISPILDVKTIIQLVQIINLHRPDIIHAHSSKAGTLARIAGYITKTPTVFTAHGWAFTDGAPFNRKAIAILTERISSHIGSRIISVSEYDTRLAHRWGICSLKQITTIENGIPDLIINKKTVKEKNLRVVMTARFAMPKNQKNLIQAAALVNNVELLLVGDGPQLNAAKSLAYELGISDRVQFLGNRSDVPEILAQADAFALISDYEGFPISTLEAMRAALPVIVSDVGGAAESVMPGVTGFVVPKGDVQAIADALKILAEQPERRESMGIAGRARFLSRYQEKDMIDKTFRVYEEVLSERGVN